jgi:hypothetical protein
LSKKRDDSYFAAGRRRNRKYMMIIIPIVAAVAAAGAAAAVLTPRGPDFGPLGSAHEHAVFQVVLDGQPIDFSQQKYQVRTQYIHVEGGDGTTLHRHSSKVPVGEFFRSVNIDIRDNCFVLDNSDQFCDDGGKQLRFFVNGTERASISDYVLQENDRILVIYGDEDQSELQAKFDELNSTPVKK